MGDFEEEAAHEGAKFNKISRKLNEYDDSKLGNLYNPWLQFSKYVYQNAGWLSFLFSAVAFAGPLMVVRFDILSLGASGLWTAIFFGVGSLFISNRLEGFHAQVRMRAVALRTAEAKADERIENEKRAVRRKFGRRWNP